MYYVQSSPLPPLVVEDSSTLHRNISFDSSAVYEGAAHDPTSRIFEAKAVHLVPRPKTSLGVSRSSPGFVPPSPPSSTDNHQSAPRYDHDMVDISISEKVGSGRGGSHRGRPPAVSRWSATAREGPPNSASASAILTLPVHDDRVPPEHCHQNFLGDSSSGRGEIPTRADFSGSPSGSAKVANVLRRTSSDGSSGDSCRGAGGASVMTSHDPGVLKGEIRRLQAALMNEFKGCNRFVGGSQFKASVRKQARSCGGCLQVREALRRSKVENRDVRGSLFRAEAVIKQLSLTTAARRARHRAHEMAAAAANDQDVRRPEMHPSLNTVDEDESNNNGDKGFALDESNLKSSRKGLLSRVRQLERELRMADFRHSQSAGAAVYVDHGLSDDLQEVRRIKSTSSGPSEKATKTERAEAPPCKKCPIIEEKLLEETTKTNGLMRRVRDHEQEATRLRTGAVEMETARIKTIEMQQKLNQMRKKAEDEVQTRERLEREKVVGGAEVERLMGDLDRWRAQALEHDSKVKRLSDQHGTFQLEASVATRRLEQTETDLVALRAAVNSERSLREKREGALGSLRRELALEKGSVEELKREATAAKEARRRVELQAEATETAHRRALKAALNSCVRLCVVAPTVNINLDDRSRSFCSGLPEEKIRAFVEGSVLPRFTRVLLQPGADTSIPDSPTRDTVRDDSTEQGALVRREEGGAGCGGGGKRSGDGQADFDTWLRDLLVDMQTSIERHVASVFQTQTAPVDALSSRRRQQAVNH